MALGHVAIQTQMKEIGERKVRNEASGFHTNLQANRKEQHASLQAPIERQICWLLGPSRKAQHAGLQAPIESQNMLASRPSRNSFFHPFSSKV